MKRPAAKKTAKRPPLSEFGPNYKNPFVLAHGGFYSWEWPPMWNLVRSLHTLRTTTEELTKQVGVIAEAVCRAEHEYRDKKLKSTGKKAKAA